jgi:hypothetical protein
VAGQAGISSSSPTPWLARAVGQANSFAPKPTASRRKSATDLPLPAAACRVSATPRRSSSTERAVKYISTSTSIAAAAAAK